MALYRESETASNPKMPSTTERIIAEYAEGLAAALRGGGGVASHFRMALREDVLYGREHVRG